MRNSSRTRPLRSTPAASEARPCLPRCQPPTAVGQACGCPAATVGPPTPPLLAARTPAFVNELFQPPLALVSLAPLARRARSSRTRGFSARPIVRSAAALADPPLPHSPTPSRSVVRAIRARTEPCPRRPKSNQPKHQVPSPPCSRAGTPLPSYRSPTAFEPLRQSRSTSRLRRHQPRRRSMYTPPSYTYARPA